MLILIMAAWLLYNGRVTLELVLIGLVLTAAVYFVCSRLFGWKLRNELRVWRKLPRIIAYLPLLVWEVLKANVQVIKVILSPRIKERTEHRLVVFPSPVKTESGRLLLANSITLTPGTITVSTPEGHMCVHALGEEFATGLEDSSFVRAIQAMEGDGHG